MNLKPTNCLNCGSPLEGNYCSECGQSAYVGKITFRETFESFLSSVFALEGPLIGTSVNLLRNPGKVFREFLSGKRRKYYKPVAYFVLLTAIYLVVRALLDYNPLEGQLPDQNISGSESEAQARQISGEAARYMVKNINNIMFLLVFSLGLMLKLFFRKRYNLAEYTAIGFYITGVYILFGFCVMLFNYFTGFRNHQIQLVFLIVYVIYCEISLFKNYNFWQLLKYLLVAAFSLVLYMILGFGFSLTIILLS